MPPETTVKHRRLRRHVDAYRCCTKSLIGSALVDFDVRQHARAESISKRAPLTTRPSLHLESITYGTLYRREGDCALNCALTLSASPRILTGLRAIIGLARRAGAWSPVAFRPGPIVAAIVTFTLDDSAAVAGSEFLPHRTRAFNRGSTGPRWRGSPRHDPWQPPRNA